MIATGYIGLEHIQRALLLIFVDQLNAEIAAVEDDWATLDLELANALERPSLRSITLERVELENFHFGSVPSLIDGDMHQFPNITVMAMTAIRDEDYDGDQYDAHVVPVAIEAMVKGTSEAIVNSRAQRMNEAIQRVVKRNASLGGLVAGGLDTPPQEAGITDAEDRGTSIDFSGDKWYWQGMRISYNATTYTS